MNNDMYYLSSDILFFAETWTKSSTNVFLNGFNQIARVNANEAVAKPCGSLIIVNGKFLSNHFTLDVLEMLYENSRSEKMSVFGFTVDNKFIASVYVSPKFSESKVLDVMRELLSVEAEYKIIAGDFNTDFLDEENEFINLFSEHGLNSVLNGSIRSTTNKAKFIDNTFSNIPLADSGRYVSVTSDHYLLYMKFNFI